MLSYRDMTFCVAPCVNRECLRKYSDDVREGAKKWWGSDEAPIALSDFSNHCDQFIKLEFKDE